jgi:transcriptional regulator with XRE-family HTH domain
MSRIDSVFEEILRRNPGIGEALQKERPRASIAAALVRVRNALGRTQRDIAASMNTPQSNVARLEKATGNPQTTEALIAYAKACGLTLGLVFIVPTEKGLAIMEATGIDEDGRSDEFLRTLITVPPVARDKEWYKKWYPAAKAAAAS